MAKQIKKTATKLKGKSRKRQDMILAVLLGVVVTAIGVFVVRYSHAATAEECDKSLYSFCRNPLDGMSGGVVKKVNGVPGRVGEQTAPGVNPVVTPVSKVEMANTLQVCVEYNVLKPGTTVNVAYVSNNTGLVTPITGPAASSGSGKVCLTTGGTAVDGAININVRPGSAQITKFYGIYRAYNN